MYYRRKTCLNTVFFAGALLVNGYKKGPVKLNCGETEFVKSGETEKQRN